MNNHPSDHQLQSIIPKQRAKAATVYEHVKQCVRCRIRLRALLNQRSYTSALAIDTKSLRALQATFARERADAENLVTELRRHPTERQRVLVCNHPRFQTWGVFEHLLEVSQQETLCDPHQGENLAQIAFDLSFHLDTSVYGFEAIEDLRARAWGYIGNARRVLFELRAAEEAFDRALIHLRRGTRESWELAVWLDLKASLLRSQRRFNEATRLLKRALVLFTSVGDRHRAGRTLVNMDNVLHRAGRPEEGIPLLYRAIELIDPTQEPRLLLTAKHNLIDDLAEAGRHMEAQKLLIQTRPLYRRFDPWLRYRKLWVEGKIAIRLAQPEEAESLLLEARRGFQEQNSAFEVALVSLELAGLFVEQEKTAELKKLAEEIVPIFSSRQIRRETLAALVLWHQAVVTETVGIEFTARTAAALKSARYDQPASNQEGL